MSEEYKNKVGFGAQPHYDFAEGRMSEGSISEKTEKADADGIVEGKGEDKPKQTETTGLENVSYDRVTNLGMPNNPTSGKSVVERDVVNVANPAGDYVWTGSRGKNGFNASGGSNGKAESKISGGATSTQRYSSSYDYYSRGGVKGSPDDRKHMEEIGKGYDDIIATVKKRRADYEPEDEEARKKREHRERSQRIMAAVSDGVSALSNLYFTTQYAPNMYQHERSSQLSPLEVSLEKLKQERKDNADKYYDYSIRIGELGLEKGKALRDLEALQEKMRMTREKHDFEKSLYPEKLRKSKGEADTAGYKAATARSEAAYADELNEAKVATEKARGDRERAGAVRNYSAAAKDNERPFVAYDEDGNRYYFKTRDAAVYFAQQHGTDEKVVLNTNTDSSDGWKETKTESGGYGRIIPKKSSKTKTQKTMPGA